jgi:hypothetical protein
MSCGCVDVAATNRRRVRGIEILANDINRCTQSPPGAVRLEKLAKKMSIDGSVVLINT